MDGLAFPPPLSLAGQHAAEAAHYAAYGDATDVEGVAIDGK